MRKGFIGLIGSRVNWRSWRQTAREACRGQLGAHSMPGKARAPMLGSLMPFSASCFTCRLRLLPVAGRRQGQAPEEGCRAQEGPGRGRQGFPGQEEGGGCCAEGLEREGRAEGRLRQGEGEQVGRRRPNDAPRLRWVMPAPAHSAGPAVPSVDRPRSSAPAAAPAEHEQIVEPGAAAASRGAGHPAELEAAPPIDCLQCRVIGTGVCLSASAYLAAQLARVPAPAGAHRVGITVFAVGFAALGVTRALI